MRPSGPPVRFSKPSDFPGVELVSAEYEERAFPPHSHPEYVIGAVVGGAETLEVGGQVHLAPAGTTLLLHPEETHANASVGADALRYRVIYVAPETMAAWLPATPHFGAPVSRAPALFEAVLRAHAALEAPADRLSREAAFAAMVAALAEQSELPGGGGGAEIPSGVARARDHIDSCFAADFSLDDLAGLAGLSRFHLVRSFKRATGLTPVAYRTQRRIEAARRLLRRNLAIAEVALEVGFADQSHLTRHFQRLMGISPARYRQQ